MKNLYLFLLFILMKASVSAQWVSSITISPPQPTTADTITIIIENTFPSGGCEGTTTLTGISGSSITAEARHCMGMLTVICTDYDTLIFLPQVLSIGTYTFAYSLVTGDGFPCTFGNLPVIDTTITFNVNPLTVVGELPQATFSIFPNPSGGQFTIRQNSENSRVRIYSADGRLMYDFMVYSPESELDYNLRPGLYYLSNESNGLIRYSKLVIEK